MICKHVKFEKLASRYTNISRKLVTESINHYLKYQFLFKHRINNLELFLKKTISYGFIDVYLLNYSLYVLEESLCIS